MSVDDDKTVTEDLMPFILQCLPATVSVVKSEQVYDRVAVLKTLLTSDTGR